MITVTGEIDGLQENAFGEVQEATDVKILSAPSVFNLTPTPFSIVGLSVGFRRYSVKDIGLHGPDRNGNRFAGSLWFCRVDIAITVTRSPRACSEPSSLDRCRSRRRSKILHAGGAKTPRDECTMATLLAAPFHASSPIYTRFVGSSRASVIVVSHLALLIQLGGGGNWE